MNRLWGRAKELCVGKERIEVEERSSSDGEVFIQLEKRRLVRARALPN